MRLAELASVAHNLKYSSQFTMFELLTRVITLLQMQAIRKHVLISTLPMYSVSARGLCTDRIVCIGGTNSNGSVVNSVTH